MITVFISCEIQQNSNSLELKKITTFGFDKRISNVFYLNFEKQKDSIESIYKFGKLSQNIFWDNGKIDSILNYQSGSLIPNRWILKGSILYTYNQKKHLIQKSSLNLDGRYQGTLLKYKDSILNEITHYSNGKINGLTVHLNDSEYPMLIGNLVENSFYFGIQFYESGTVKSLRINNKNDKLGIIYNYYSNGQIKDKTELEDGKVHGMKYKFDEFGKIITKNKYNKGILYLEN